MPNPPFVYFDQNVLRDMAEGHLEPIRKLLFEDCGMRLVYSTENLEELRRAPEKYHESTLGLLRSVNAAFARMAVDFKSASIDLEVDPAQAFAEHRANVAPFSDLDYTMHGYSLKYFGGAADESWEEVSRKQRDEVWRILDVADSAVDSVEGCPPEIREQIRHGIRVLRERADEVARDFAKQMEETSEGPFGAASLKEQGISSNHLNNIRPPNVVRQVWDKVRHVFEPGGLTLEQTFGIEPIPGVERGTDEFSLVQKVNLIYHQLNILGYFPDEGMKKLHRQKASFSDMTHAGYAMCAQLFVCRDDALVKKVVAAYEYLGLRKHGVLQIIGNPRKDPGPIQLHWAWTGGETGD